MKKISLFIILILFASKYTAQMNKGTHLRMYMGPDITYMTNGSYSVGKGVIVGYNSGIEGNVDFGPHFAGLAGINFNLTSFQRYVNDPSSPIISSFEKGYFLEVPLGIRLGFCDIETTGPFVSFFLINSITLSSSADYSYKDKSGVIIDNNIRKDIFNTLSIGAKIEAGYRGRLTRSNDYTVSVAIKPMYLGNKLDEKFSTIGTSFLLGCYF